MSTKDKDKKSKSSSSSSSSKKDKDSKSSSSKDDKKKSSKSSSSSKASPQVGRKTSDSPATPKREKESSSSSTSTSSSTSSSSSSGAAAPAPAPVEHVKAPKSKSKSKEDGEVVNITLPQVIGYEDMTKMEDMTLDGVLSNLEDRYAHDLIYTFTSSILVAINPYQRLPIYGKEWIRYYKGKRIGLLSPHVYAVAEAAFSSMIQTNKNQSVLVSGESGAGKTETTKLIMQFLSERRERESEDENSIDKMVLATFPVLEALGNAKTGRNDNSSRFGKFIEIQFNEDGYIHGARIIPYLLEKSRIVRQTKGERNYHIFYNVTNGMPAAEQPKFHLHRWDYFDYLNTTGCYTVEGVSEEHEFSGFRECLRLFSMSEDIIDGIFSIVSSVLHLGNVHFSPDGDKAVYRDARSEDSVAIVAELMGLDPERLKWGLKNRKIKTMREIIDKPLNAEQAKDQTDAFAKHAYATLFDWTVQQLNANMVSETFKSFIGVLDIFGFEVFEVNSFEQFLINYTNEKLQQFFNHQIFKLEQKIYEEETIDWSVIEFKDNQECLDLIEKRRPAGLLAILDEESKFPKATDESLIEKLHSNFDKKHAYYERPRMKKYHFSVKHFAGSVEYDVRGWRDKNRDELPDHLTQLLQSSSKDFVSILYTGEGLEESQGGGGGGGLRDSTGGAGKRASVGPASPPVEKKSPGPGASGTDTSKLTLGAQFKQQLTDLMAMLGSTEPYFIRCIKPNTQKKPNLLDQKLTYDQLLYAGMLETIRIRRMGYPIRYSLADFFKRYRCICPEVAAQPSEKDTAHALVRAIGVNIPYECQIGLTKVFFKQDTANDLEDRRLIALTSVIIKMQTWWRMVALRAGFVEKRENAIVLQSWYRYVVRQRRFVTERKAAGLLQAYYRMLRAIRIRLVLAEAKRKAEEARRRKEEEERKKRIAKLGLEQVEAEEHAKAAAEADQIRALAAGVSLEPDEEEEAKKAKRAKMQRSASIKMEKLQELEVPINVDGKIILGLGWKASEWDLDVSILLFRFASHKEDVYFYKPRSRDGAIVHKSGWTGSKRSRFGQDNEHIEINLSKLTPKTNNIIIVATVFNPKGTFSSVQDAYVRLVDPNSDHEFCHYPVPPSSNTANIICKLYRYGFTRWRLKAIGEASGGRVYKHMISKVQPFLEAEPPKRKFRVTIHQGEFVVKYPEGQEPGRKSTMNTVCNISYDAITEKTKIAKADAPKQGGSLSPSYTTAKTVSGNANQLEVTVLQSKRMGRESFLGRVIIDLDPKSKVAITEQSFKLEDSDKEWARDLLLITGTITVSIEEL